jgi:hypothetical protein
MLLSKANRPVPDLCRNLLEIKSLSSHDLISSAAAAAATTIASKSKAPVVSMSYRQQEDGLMIGAAATAAGLINKSS